jgi:hypothetical protein
MEKRTEKLTFVFPLHQHLTMPEVHYCGHCGQGPIPTSAGVLIHIKKTKACHEKWKKKFGELASGIWAETTEPVLNTTQESSETVMGPEPPTDGEPIEDASAVDDTTMFEDGPILDELHFDAEMLVDEEPDTPEPPPAQHRSQRVTVEEVEDDDADTYTRYVDSCPSEWKAGHPIGEGIPAFEQIRAELLAEGNEWGPFKGEDEWDLAEWLIKNLGQTQTDTFLKLPIVR